ncbi:hypothetical protein BP5796_07142 [Coleophoma crateriformis]|uniref:Uncharacterized protein n=1 Tax=Coleophoma crateriformis TaxID=565419 RepID=A0A3D8RIA2_9HELO|nr:hypothetical protein BP5796_07142 [Coleophoma crateriformis]
MSSSFPSSNPFRRKGSEAPDHNPVTQNKLLTDITNLDRQDVPRIQTKPVKKVRVQSPPPSSPEEDTWSTNRTAPLRRNDLTTATNNDPFGGTISDTSDDESPVRVGQAPPNPFQKTLETMEGGAVPAGVVANPARVSMNVEAFKRLLMTGDSGLGSSTASSTPTAPTLHPGLGDGGSSTDTSSISRQSIFEPVQEPHPESPRTSHEVSEPEEERRRFSTDYTASTATGRKKPPPPSSRHGKLIKMELKDSPTSDVHTSPTQDLEMPKAHFNTSSSSLSSIKSPTDLNKPLPPAPERASHESERESIFDKEAAGKTPEPPSPSLSVKRKTPPAPPISRRHSQLVSDSRLSKLDSGRLSMRMEEDNASIAGFVAGRPRADSAKAPPPPPSRRPGSIRASNSSTSIPVSSVISLPPAVPPTRASSMRQRPPSVSSMETLSSRRASFVPPPPPPHRHGRASFDLPNAPIVSPGSRTSGEYSRRSTDSMRRDSTASSSSYVDRPGTASSGKDILADLSALQREIDALRNASAEKQAT